MPFSNAIPITPGGLDSVVSYLTDESHKDHIEYRLSSLELAGTRSVEEFIGMAKSTVASNRHPLGRMRPGRPPKNAAQWYIARVSDGTWLTPDERRAYMEALQQESSHGGRIVGLGNFHRNRLTGSEDINWISIQFSESGKLLRCRTMNPVASLRFRIDSVTEELNLKRLKRGIAPIQTMAEAQSIVREQRKTFVIEEALSRLPKPPRTASDLVAELISIGCEVTRKNLKTDTISIKKPNARKAKRYGILALLNTVSDLIKERIPAPPKLRNVPGIEM